MHFSRFVERASGKEEAAVTIYLIVIIAALLFSPSMEISSG
jgi:hypothetical protein